MEKEEVTHKPQPQQVRIATQVQNKYDCLIDNDDDEEDEASKCNDCISWPVVGKGGKVNKWVLGKGNFGKREKHQKFKRFDFTSAIGGVKFIGAVEDERAGGGSNGFELPVDRCQEAIASSKTNYRKRVMSPSLAPQRATIILKISCLERRSC